MRPILLAAFLALLPGIAFGQRPPSPDLAQQREHMAQLRFLQGTWQGSGWMEWQPGQRSSFSGSEKVETRLDGLILIVEGQHTVRIPNEGTERVIHHALGVLSWDEAAGHYRFDTRLIDGYSAAGTGRMQDGKFVWSPGKSNGMETRYTIGLDDEGRWSEIGERSQDGKTWKQFFAMTLERVEP